MAKWVKKLLKKNRSKMGPKKVLLGPFLDVVGPKIHGGDGGAGGGVWGAVRGIKPSHRALIFGVLGLLVLKETMFLGFHYICIFKVP